MIVRVIRLGVVCRWDAREESKAAGPAPEMHKAPDVRRSRQRSGAELQVVSAAKRSQSKTQGTLDGENGAFGDGPE